MEAADISSESRASAPRFSELLTLAWPIVLARATQSVIGFTDALFIAPLGEEPLAAVTTGSLNAFAAIVLPTGTVFIIQSFAAQLRGKGELDRVRRYASYGLVLALLAGLIAAAAIPLVPRALALLDYAPRVQRLMTIYLSIRLLSVGPAVATEALGNWYGGLGNTRLAMVAGVVTMLANVIGAYTFIQPHFGLPGYGVSGAAWASVGATWLGFLVIAACYYRGVGHTLAPQVFAFEGRELWRVLRFGLPNGINWFLEFMAFILFIDVAVAHLGTTVLAAFNVVMQVNSVAFMPAFGMASAGAIMVGETIGSGRKEAVSSVVRLTALTNCAWMLSVGLFYLALPKHVLGVFAPAGGGEQLVAIGAAMLQISALWQLFDALGMTLSEALRAAGDTTWCMAARIALAWLCFTPLAWMAVFLLHGGVTTVMLSLVFYLVALAAVFAWRFVSKRWQNLDLIGEPPVSAP